MNKNNVLRKILSVVQVLALIYLTIQLYQGNLNILAIIGTFILYIITVINIAMIIYNKIIISKLLKLCKEAYDSLEYLNKKKRIAYLNGNKEEIDYYQKKVIEIAALIINTIRNINYIVVSNKQTQQFKKIWDDTQNLIKN